MKKEIHEKTEALHPDIINMQFMEMGTIDPKLVDMSLEVQRDLENSRLKNINRSMEKMGGTYDISKPIILDQHGKGIDGKHRVEVSIQRSIPIIPYIKYKFATKNDVIKYFSLTQQKTAPMKARDVLFAHYKFKHPYAVLIYSLCEDKRSLFSGCHDLKLKQGHKPSNDLIKVENICYIINNIALKRKNGWSIGTADYLHTLALPIITNPKNIQIALDEVNEFLQFFFNSFGWETKKSKLQFKEAFLLATLTLFNDSLIPHPYFVKDQRVVENKLSKLPLVEDVVKNHRDVIVHKLLKCINSKRTKVKRCYI